MMKGDRHGRSKPRQLERADAGRVNLYAGRRHPALGAKCRHQRRVLQYAGLCGLQVDSRGSGAAASAAYSAGQAEGGLTGPVPDPGPSPADGSHPRSGPCQTCRRQMARSRHPLVVVTGPGWTVWATAPAAASASAQSRRASRTPCAF